MKNEKCKMQNDELPRQRRCELLPSTIAKKNEPAHRSFYILHCILFPLILVGCKDSKESTTVSRSSRPAGAAVSRQYHNELLTYAVDNLNRLEQFDSGEVLQELLEQLNAKEDAPEPSKDAGTLLAVWPQTEMLRQVVDRLNQWIRTQSSPADWRLDPMAAGLPEPLAALPEVRNLNRMEFSRFDGFALEGIVWLRDVGFWAEGDELDDLVRAGNLFDWTVRNIQLEADAPRRVPLFPGETLLFGRGDAAERAWLFVLLARQLGIEAAVLGFDREPRAEEEPGISPLSPLPSPLSPRLWCVAVLIEGNAYLFDPLLGLPIPAPDGISLDKEGRLAIRPATLEQVVSDPKLLRQLDADEKRPYGVKASDLEHIVVMLEASPTYLARRMKLLESRLVGPQKMVLSSSPTDEAGRWKAPGRMEDVRLWLHPFETLQRRSHLGREQIQERLAALVPFYAMPQAPLRRGRVLYLKGRFVGDDGATRYYQAARPSNAELTASSAHPIEKLLLLRGKQDASYWLGLIAYQRGNYTSAIDYFTARTLLFMPSAPDRPWTNGARYNLARTYEAAGDPQRAALQYNSNVDSPGYLGDLLRAKWLEEQTKAAK